VSRGRVRELGDGKEEKEKHKGVHGSKTTASRHRKVVGLAIQVYLGPSVNHS
jgi:hypothetical protein